MRVRWRDFSKGLFYGGSRETVPPGFCRRLTGLVPQGDYLRMRYRHEGRVVLPTADLAADVHSLYRFEDQIYYGASTGFGSGTPGAASGAPIVASALAGQSSGFLLGTFECIS